MKSMEDMSISWIIEPKKFQGRKGSFGKASNSGHLLEIS